MGARKLKAWLAQQSLWDQRAAGLQSMPLAMGYLKATADGDPTIRADVDNKIFCFDGADTELSVIQKMFVADMPDVASFSILGWNYHLFGRATQTYRQLNPEGWSIWGGTHVMNQAPRVFREYPAVDIIVNGEGEFTYCDLLRANLAGRSKYELDDIKGISFRNRDGEIVNTPPAERIQDLNRIPSPFLTGAIDLTDAHGKFLYDVAIMETNRGCPYACSFCFWGGSIGQKMRAFDSERLREELELFGKLGVKDIVLCDSNFGMTKGCEEFTEALIKTREKYGNPQEVITSWAKNKTKRFYSIVKQMKEHGFKSSFTLALQTLNDTALERMRRANMKVNEWEDLVEWLRRERLDVYGELIWGCPGETSASFLEGFDRLSVAGRVAVYPNLMLPNTEYSENREKYGFVTWKSDKDDFERILSHETMTVQENREMHRFIFWARTMCEYPFFRFIWEPLRVYAGLTHSQCLLSFDRWLDTHEGKGAAELRALRGRMVEHLDAYDYEDALSFIHGYGPMKELMLPWWEEFVLPKVADDLKPFFRCLFEYDFASHPVFIRRSGGDAAGHGQLSSETVAGNDYYVSQSRVFEYDVPTIVRKIYRKEDWSRSPEPHAVTLYFLRGFSDFMLNHEFYLQYVGRTKEEILVKPSSTTRDDTSTPPPLPPVGTDPEAMASRGRLRVLDAKD